MYSSAHKKLAQFIAKKFSLNKNCERELIRGSLHPDRKKSSWNPKPHHFGREEEIENLIYKARRNFLKGELTMSCYFLGYALHFVADAPIYSPALYPRYKKGRGAGLKTWHAKRRARKFHEEFEKEISKLDFIPSLPFFVLSTPLEIEDTLRKFLYKDIIWDPQHTLQRIYRTSFALTEICFRNPSILNQDEKEILKAIPKRKIKWFFVAVIFIALFFIFLFKFFHSFLPIMWIAVVIPLSYFFSVLWKYVNSLKNPWKLEGWYRKKISIFGLSSE